MNTVIQRDRKTDIHTMSYIHRDRHKDRQKDRKTEGQRDRKSYRHADAERSRD